MKTLQLALILLLSNICLANEGSISFFSNEENEIEQNDKPTDPDLGDDPDDVAPIDQYAPLLVLGGVAVYAFSRKKFQLK